MAMAGLLFFIISLVNHQISSNASNYSHHLIDMNSKTAQLTAVDAYMFEELSSEEFEINKSLWLSNQEPIKLLVNSLFGIFYFNLLFQLYFISYFNSDLSPPLN